MKNKKNRTLLIAFIVFIVIIAISIFNGLMIPIKQESKEIFISEDREISEFVSTEENPYDTTKTTEEENLKEEIDDVAIAETKNIIIPMLASGKWAEALDYLDEYFKTHSYKSEEGMELKAYQDYLVVMNQLSTVSQDMYEPLFKSFEAPEAFLASMIYYPPSVKISGFLSLESLIPTTETNNIQIYEIKKVKGSKMLNEINKNFNDEYKGVWIQEFVVDNVRLTAYFAERNDGIYMIYKIMTSDEKNYFMTVKEWIEILNLYE